MSTLWKRYTGIIMFGSSSKEYDLTKLKVGYTFSLYKEEWKIIEIGEYDWRMDNTSVEYTIISNNKKAYLEVEFHKGKYEVTFSEAITISDAILEDGIQTHQIINDNTLFEFDEKFSGDYKNLTTNTNRENLDCYVFYAENDALLIVEKWGDGSYEAFLGEEIKAKKVKNIKEN